MLPIGVMLFALPRYRQYNLMTAASPSVLIPLLVVTLIFQWAFIQDIVLTGMKY